MMTLQKKNVRASACHQKTTLSTAQFPLKSVVPVLKLGYLERTLPAYYPRTSKKKSIYDTKYS